MRLQALKDRLLSRDPLRQNEGLDFIISNLDVDCDERIEKFVSLLCDNDILECLGGALSSTNESVLEGILVCLKKLAQFDYFYHNNHPIHIIECLLRTVSFLQKNKSISTIFYDSVQLLANILVRFSLASDSGFLLDELLNVEQMFEIVRMMVKRLKHDNVQMILCTGFLLKSLFCNSMHMSSYYTVVNLCKECIPFLLNIAMSKKQSSVNFDADSDLAVMELNDIGYHIFRLYSEIKLQSMKSESNVVVEVCQIVSDYIVNVCVPHVMDTNISKTYLRLCESLFSVLYCLLNEWPYRFEVVRILARRKILIFFDYVIKTSGQNMEIQGICCSNLARVLSLLTEYHFHTDTLESDFVIELFHFLSESNVWKKTIQYKEMPQSFYHTAVMYFYFNILYSNSINIPLVLDLVPYLMSYQFHSDPSNTVATTTTWIIVSMLTTCSYINDCHFTEIDKVNSIMVKLLELHECSIRDVYTHHPALLSWSLICSVAPQWIPVELIKLWLEKEKGFETNMIKMWGELPDFYLYLLDVALSSDELVAQLAADHLLVKLQSGDRRGKELLLFIWHRLPEALSTVTCQKLSTVEPVLNFRNLAKLASVNIPEEITNDTLSSVASCLARLLPKCDDSRETLIILCNELLIVSTARRNKRVLSLFFNDQRFLITLQQMLNRCDYRSTTTFVNTVVFLGNAVHSHFLLKMQCYKHIFVSGEFLVNLLISSNFELKKATLHFMYWIMNSAGYPSLVQLTSDDKSIIQYTEAKYSLFISSDDNILTLYFILLSQCIKDLQLASHICMFMTTIVQFCTSRKESLLIKQVTTSPLTFTVIESLLKWDGTLIITEEFLSFITLWLACYVNMYSVQSKIDTLSKYKIKKGVSCFIVHRLFNSIVNTLARGLKDFDVNDSLSSVKSKYNSLIDMILQLNFDIGEDVSEILHMKQLEVSTCS